MVFFLIAQGNVVTINVVTINVVTINVVTINSKVEKDYCDD